MEIILDRVDTSEYCSTFPKKVDKELEREFLIDTIRKIFTNGQKVIMVEGPESSGKTVLLTQFARLNCNRSVSFFVGDDYWGSNLHRYLTDMCEQMKYLCGKKLSKTLVNVDIPNLKEPELKHLFSKMYIDIVNQARNGNGPFYFIIDGVNRLLNKHSEEDILKLIPLGDASGVYTLLSSTKGEKYPFKYTPWEIPYFSKLEVQDFLSVYMDSAQIASLYEASDGLPGYISEIFRQIGEGEAVDKIISDLPPGFNALLIKEWNKLQLTDELTEILSLIVFSPEYLNVNKICHILNVDQIIVTDFIKNISFVQFENESKNIRIIGAYRSFLSNKLESNRHQINQKLIRYYEINPLTQNSLVHLPDLYQQNKQFDALVNLIKVDSIVQTFQHSGEVSLVRQNLRILSDMAYENEEWERLSWAALAEAVFTRIITSPPAIDDEIEALLSLKEHEQALKLSYACALPEDRLMALSKVCSYMIREGHQITDEILKSLEETVNLIDNTVDLNEQIINKIIDICCDLFPIDSKLTSRLLTRICEDSSNARNKDDLLEDMLLRILLKLGPEFGEIKEHLENEWVYDFLNVTSSVMTDISIDRVLKQVEQVSEVSSKIFLLQYWCNSSSNDYDSYKIVEFALNLMIESIDYSPTQLHLRQFAQALLKSKVEPFALKELVNQFDMLKETVLKNPLDEHVRLELTLALIEKKWSSDEAVERLYKVYYLLDEIEELDTRCSILIRILLSLSELAPEDEAEIRRQFFKEFIELLGSSANHIMLLKRLLPPITQYDPSLALLFVNKINTERRRDIGYAEVLRIYTYRDEEKIDLNFIDDVLSKIKEDRFRDWVLVNIIRRFSDNKILLDNSFQDVYFNKIVNVKSTIGRSYGYAYLLSWINGSNDELCAKIFSHLKESITMIDSYNEKINIGFRIIHIIARVSESYGKELFDLVNQQRIKSSFYDTRLNELYIETCEIVIRMVPEIMKNFDAEEKINCIQKFIKLIPSKLNQCELLANLALRCKTSSNETLFNEIVNDCLKICESILDEETYNLCILNISPALFEYEREILYEKLTLMSLDMQDDALLNVINFIVAKRPPEDYISIGSMNLLIEYKDAIKVCELLERMNTDVSIFNVVSALVDLLTLPSRNGNGITSPLIERQLLNIADKIAGIVSKKLPDKRNIKHGGYRIAIQACIAKLRDAASHRANVKWKMVSPSWGELQREAKFLPNTADKVFVLSYLGEKSYHSDPSASTSSLKDAEEVLIDINNFYDRADRYQSLAEVYKNISNSAAAKYLIQQAMNYASLCSHDQGRDKLIGGIIEVAHSIDQSLASTLASKMDTPGDLRRIKDTILALNLHTEPHKIDQYQKGQYKRLFNPIFHKVLTSIYTGKGIAQHNKIVGKWIYNTLGQDYETVKLGVTWFVENTNLSNNSSKQSLNNLFDGAMQLIEMIHLLGNVLSSSAVSEQENPLYSILIPEQKSSMQINTDLISKIKNWVSNNSYNYLRIVFPTFEESYLDILKVVPQDIRVYILTSTSNSVLSNYNSIIEKYKTSWSKICDQAPPDTNFFVFSTDSGQTPIYEPFVITDQGGLAIVSSNNFEFELKELSIQEKQDIENHVINPLLIMPPMFFEDERLTVKPFSLN